MVGPLVFGMAAFPLTLVGQVRRAASIRRTRLDTTATPRAAGTGADRPVLATVLTLPLVAVAFVLSLLVVYLGYFGELYPLRPDAIGELGSMFRPSSEIENAWGGPLLVGAWFIHAMVAVGMQLWCLAGIRGLGALSGMIARRLLGR